MSALLAGQLDYRADIDDLVSYAWAAMLSRQWARCDEVLSIVENKVFEFGDQLKKNNVSNLCKMMACIRDLGDHIQKHTPRLKQDNILDIAIYADKNREKLGRVGRATEPMLQ